MNSTRVLRSISSILMLAIWVCACKTLPAQRILDRVLQRANEFGAPAQIPRVQVPSDQAPASTVDTPGPIDVLAVSGQPFGVATFLLPVGRTEELPRILIHEKDSQVFYPAFALEDLLPRNEPPPINQRRIGQGALINRLRNVIQNSRDKIDPPKAIRCYCLFKSIYPSLEITVDGESFPSQRFTIPVDANQDPSLHSQMMERWWNSYSQQASRQLESSDFPPLVQTYLTSMLASRLELPLIDLRDRKKVEKGEFDQPLSTLSLLGGVESLRNELMRKSLSEPASSTDAIHPLPSPPIWQDPVAPPVPDDLPIESIAARVPKDCFYLRFAKFSNYLWFQELTADRGGDFVQLAIRRGYNYDTAGRIEQMLNTKTTAIAKLFGDSIIGDMAIIGQDLYIQDGPSLGVLFEAKNAGLLVQSFTQERASTAKRLDDCVLEDIEIDGVPVSFLHTPDNRVRSLMVVDGNFVLITTSRHIAKRFLQVAKGEPSLSSDPHFRYARLLLPIQNDYSVFGYFSNQFLQNLVGPKYQIELRRRLQAIAHIQSAELARRAAAAEGMQDANIDELIRESFLPPWFNERPDGSRTLALADDWIDASRGKQGSMVPIADMEISEITDNELREYQTQEAFYLQDWKQTDPLLFGLRRFAVPDFPDRERLAIEAFIAPFGQDKLKWIGNMLAPPINTEIQLPPDDVMNFQVHLAGNVTNRGASPDHVLFGGLKDMIPPQPGDELGLLGTLRALRDTPAYLGAWPAAGYLDRLPLGLGGGRPDAFGFSRALIGMWRWQGEGLSLLSFDRSIIEQCLNYIQPVQASAPAQARIQLGDIANSQLATWVNTYIYRQSLTTSRGNALLLDAFEQQLGVPPEETLSAAESVLDCELQCAVEGDYRLSESPTPMWRSDAWPAPGPAEEIFPPSSYTAPMLEWFRGVRVHLTQLSDRLVLVGQIDMEPIPVTEAPANETENALPKMDFDLFKLPFNVFGGSKQDTAPPKPKRREF